MQFTLLALSAFAASALAAPQASSSENIVSVLSVLETALPSSLLAEALTNSAAVVSEVSSEFAAGETPSWFSALPSDIQTYLVPAVTTAATGANITAAPSVNATALSGFTNSIAISAGQSSILASIQSQNASVVSAASVRTSTVAGSSSTASSGSSSGSSGSSSSSSGGTMPTAVYGMGLAGALGLVGVFAL